MAAYLFFNLSRNGLFAVTAFLLSTTTQYDSLATKVRPLAMKNSNQMSLCTKSGWRSLVDYYDERGRLTVDVATDNGDAISLSCVRSDIKAMFLI